jgi:hypothetical protein
MIYITDTDGVLWKKCGYQGKYKIFITSIPNKGFDIACKNYTLPGKTWCQECYPTNPQKPYINISQLISDTTFELVGAL